MKDRAWDLVELPEGRNAVRCRWVFKVKYNADRTVQRDKARLVVKRYLQEATLDYEENYS